MTYINTSKMTVSICMFGIKSSCRTNQYWGVDKLRALELNKINKVRLFTDHDKKTLM